MKFKATAEHSGGASVGHPCKTGVFSDPTDSWEETIEADDIDDARDKAQTALESIVEEAEECHCQRKRQAGGERWWNSVSISLWPQDAEAMTAWSADRGDETLHDPYGLIPVELLPVVCEE